MFVSSMGVVCGDLSFLAVVVPFVDLGSLDVEPLCYLGDLLWRPNGLPREFSLKNLANFRHHTPSRDKGLRIPLAGG